METTNDSDLCNLVDRRPDNFRKETGKVKQILEKHERQYEADMTRAITSRNLLYLSLLKGEVCEHCNKHFPDLQALLKHLQEILEPNKKSKQRHSSQMKEILERKYKTRSQDNAHNKSLSQNSIRNETSFIKTHKMSRVEQTLSKRIKEASKQQQLSQLQIFTKQTKRSHDKYYCRKCYKPFTTLSQSREHRKTEHSELKFHDLFTKVRNKPKQISNSKRPIVAQKIPIVKLNKMEIVERTPRNKISYKCIKCNKLFHSYITSSIHRTAVHPNSYHRDLFTRTALIQTPNSSVDSSNTNEIATNTFEDDDVSKNYDENERTCQINRNSESHHHRKIALVDELHEPPRASTNVPSNVEDTDRTELIDDKQVENRSRIGKKREFSEEYDKNAKLSKIDNLTSKCEKTKKCVVIPLYQCDSCNLHFIRLKEVKRHSKVCRGKDAELGITCRRCCIPFYPYEESVHKILHHQTGRERLTFDIIKVVNSRKYKGEEGNKNSDEDFTDLARISCSALPKRDTQIRPVMLPQHKPNLYKCDICSIHFMRRRTLQSHMSLAIHNPITKTRCTICNLNFTKKSLATHIKLHHMQSNLTRNDFHITTDVHEMINLDDKHDSSSETLTKKAKSQIVGVNKSGHSIYSDLDDTPLDSYKNDLVTNDKLIHKSNKTSLFKYDKFIDDMSEKRKFNLEYNNSGYNIDSDLDDTHLAIYRNDENDKFIDDNKISIKRKFNLEYSNTLYKCNICSLHFNTAKTLQVHMSIGVHNFKTKTICGFCGFAFSSISLGRHKYVHHEMMKLKREDFHISTSNETSIVKGITADTLDMSISASTNFKGTGNCKPSKIKKNLYRCQICSLYFVTAKGLQAHMFDDVHDLEKKKCADCGFIFTPASLKHHRSLHHDILKMRKEDFVVKDTVYLRSRGYTTQETNKDETEGAMTEKDIDAIKQKDNSMKITSVDGNSASNSNKYKMKKLLYRCEICDVYYMEKGNLPNGKSDIKCLECNTLLKLMSSKNDIKDPENLKDTGKTVSSNEHNILVASEKNKAVKKLVAIKEFSSTTCNSNISTDFNRNSEESEYIDDFDETSNDTVKMRQSQLFTDDDFDAGFVESEGKTNTERSLAIVNEHMSYLANVGEQIANKPHRVKLFKCGECNVYFLKEATCLDHVYKHVPLHPTDYTECKECGLQFRYRSLEIHRKKQHDKHYKLEDVLIEEYEPSAKVLRRYLAKDKSLSSSQTAIGHVNENDKSPEKKMDVKVLKSTANCEDISKIPNYSELSMVDDTEDSELLFLLEEDANKAKSSHNAGEVESTHGINKSNMIQNTDAESHKMQASFETIIPSQNQKQGKSHHIEQINKSQKSKVVMHTCSNCNVFFFKNSSQEPTGKQTFSYLCENCDSQCKSGLQNGSNTDTDKVKLNLTNNNSAVANIAKKQDSFINNSEDNAALNVFESHNLEENNKLIYASNVVKQIDPKAIQDSIEIRSENSVQSSPESYTNSTMEVQNENTHSTTTSNSSHSFVTNPFDIFKDESNKVMRKPIVNKQYIPDSSNSNPESSEKMILYLNVNVLNAPNNAPVVVANGDSQKSVGNLNHIVVNNVQNVTNTDGNKLKIVTQNTFERDGTISSLEANNRSIITAEERNERPKDEHNWLNMILKSQHHMEERKQLEIILSRINEKIKINKNRNNINKLQPVMSDVSDIKNEYSEINDDASKGGTIAVDKEHTKETTLKPGEENTNNHQNENAAKVLEKNNVITSINKIKNINITNTKTTDDSIQKNNVEISDTPEEKNETINRENKVDEIILLTENEDSDCEIITEPCNKREFIEISDNETDLLDSKLIAEEKPKFTPKTNTKYKRVKTRVIIEICDSESEDEVDKPINPRKANMLNYKRSIKIELNQKDIKNIDVLKNAHHKSSRGTVKIENNDDTAVSTTGTLTKEQQPVLTVTNKTRTEGLTKAPADIKVENDSSTSISNDISKSNIKREDHTSIGNANNGQAEVINIPQFTTKIEVTAGKSDKNVEINRRNSIKESTREYRKKSCDILNKLQKEVKSLDSNEISVEKGIKKEEALVKREKVKETDKYRVS